MTNIRKEDAVRINKEFLSFIQNLATASSLHHLGVENVSPYSFEEAGTKFLRELEQKFPGSRRYVLTDESTDFRYIAKTLPHDQQRVWCVLRMLCIIEQNDALKHLMSNRFNTLLEEAVNQGHISSEKFTEYLDEFSTRIGHYLVCIEDTPENKKQVLDALCIERTEFAKANASRRRHLFCRGILFGALALGLAIMVCQMPITAPISLVAIAATTVMGWLAMYHEPRMSALLDMDVLGNAFSAMFNNHAAGQQELPPPYPGEAPRPGEVPEAPHYMRPPQPEAKPEAPKSPDVHISFNVDNSDKSTNLGWNVKNTTNHVTKGKKEKEEEKKKKTQDEQHPIIAGIFGIAALFGTPVACIRYLIEYSRAGDLYTERAAFDSCMVAVEGKYHANPRRP